MATDVELDSICRQIIPLVKPFMDHEQQTAVNDQLEAGEPYEALTWLLPLVLDEHVTLPEGFAHRIFEVLETDDKDEFRPLVTQSFQPI